MKLRKLAMSEVTITVEIEPEDLDYTKGHFDDPETVAWISKRLDSGHQEAWCSLKVTASWNGYSGTTYLGGCSYDCGQHPTGDKVLRVFTEVATEHGMQEEALDSLNAKLAATADKLEPLTEG